MPAVSVIILTKNEEGNIASVVANAKQLTDRVLVVDSGSTDQTVRLARKCGAEVVFRAWDDDFAAQRNFALAQARTDWVLYLDADERLNDELVQAAKKAILANADKQYALQRKSVAFGKKFNYGVLKPDYVPRLFKASHVKWINKVHEKSVCDDKLEILNGHIEHYTYSGWEQWTKKFNQYTSIWAQDAYAKGKRTSLPHAFGHAFFGFVQMAVLKRGILDGGMGLVLCCNHFFYTLMKYLKLLDIQRKGGAEK